MSSNNDKVNNQQKQHIVTIQNMYKTFCGNKKTNNGINKNGSKEIKTKRKTKV